MLTIGLAADRDFIRVRFEESPFHRTLSKTGSAVTDAVLPKGTPQAAGAACGLQRFMIACAAVMD